MSKINYFAFEKSYRERRRNNHSISENIDEFEELLTRNGKVYEVLLDSPVKLFVDVDGVPKDKTNLIYKFIDDFKKFMKSEFHVNINKYALTKNEGSTSHVGLSYHVYFPEFYVEKIYVLKHILLRFVKYNSSNKYYDYLDGCIYHYNRLFRCPNQYNASRESIDELDIHKIVNGTIKDCVIQYVDDSTELDIDIDTSKIKGITLKHVSIDVEKIKLKKETKNKSNIIKAITEKTNYKTMKECEKENEEKAIAELKDEIIICYVEHEKDTSKLNLDKKSKKELQSHLTKLKWHYKSIDEEIEKFCKELEIKNNKPKPTKSIKSVKSKVKRSNDKPTVVNDWDEIEIGEEAEVGEEPEVDNHESEEAIGIDI